MQNIFISTKTSTSKTPATGRHSGMGQKRNSGYVAAGYTELKKHTRERIHQHVMAKHKAAKNSQANRVSSTDETELSGRGQMVKTRGFMEVGMSE